MIFKLLAKSSEITYDSVVCRIFFSFLFSSSLCIFLNDLSRCIIFQETNRSNFSWKIFGLLSNLCELDILNGLSFVFFIAFATQSTMANGTQIWKGFFRSTFVFHFQKIALSADGFGQKPKIRNYRRRLHQSDTRISEQKQEFIKRYFSTCFSFFFFCSKLNFSSAHSHTQLHFQHVYSPVK